MKPSINNIDSHWTKMLLEEMKESYFLKLLDFLDTEEKRSVIYPKPNLIFESFRACSYNRFKVLILGQDPYHGDQQANGLSFSVNENIKPPPSLRNIFKELADDLDIEQPRHGNLQSWAKQGVLLLNSVLTVNKGEPASHQNQGWETFTDNIISRINENCSGIVFILWGNYAKKKKVLIDQTKHHIIESVHPSPFSARNGFFGSKPFSKTNEILRNLGKEEINWIL